MATIIGLFSGLVVSGFIFAAIFGTPISGAVFGIEVLFVGAILYDVLLPSIVSGITAYVTNLFRGGKAAL